MNQRKQQLQHNELADWIELEIQKWRPYAQPVAIGLVVAAVVIGGGIWFYLSRMDAIARSWASHFDAVDRAMFEGAVDPLQRHSTADGDPLARLWSRQYVGDAKLKDGIASLYRDRKTAMATLDEALAAFDEVIGQARTGTMLHDHASFGRALALESMGRIDDAKTAYRELVDAGAERPIGILASRYLARLEAMPDAPAFYERFVAHTPSAVPPAGFPTDGFGPAPTGDGLRPLPDLSFPDETLPESGTNEESSTETPASNPMEESTVPPMSETGAESGNSETTSPANAEGTGNAGEPSETSSSEETPPAPASPETPAPPSGDGSSGSPQ